MPLECLIVEILKLSEPLTNEISFGTDGDTLTVHHKHTMNFLSSKYFSHGLPDCQTDRNFLSLERSYFRFCARVSSSVLFLFKGFSGMAPLLYFNCSAILDNYEIKKPREVREITSE